MNTIELEKLEKIVSKIQNNLSLKKPDLVYHDNLEEFKYRIKIYDIHLFFNYESRTISNSTEKEIITYKQCQVAYMYLLNLTENNKYSTSIIRQFSLMKNIVNYY